MPGIERADQLVAFELRADRILELRKYQRDAVCIELRIEVLEHVSGGRVDVGNRLGRDDDPAGCRLRGGQVSNLVAERPNVREEQRSIEPEDHQPGHQLGVRVAGEVVESRQVPNPPEHGLIRPPGAAERVGNRQPDCERDPPEHAEQHDAEQRDDRQHEVLAALMPEPDRAADIRKRQ